MGGRRQHLLFLNVLYTRPYMGSKKLENTNWSRFYVSLKSCRFSFWMKSWQVHKRAHSTVWRERRMTSKKVKSPRLGWIEKSCNKLKVCWQPRLVLSQQTDDIRSNSNVHCKKIHSTDCIQHCVQQRLHWTQCTGIHHCCNTAWARNLMQCICSALQCTVGRHCNTATIRQESAQGLGVAHSNFHWRPACFPQRWWVD